MSNDRDKYRISPFPDLSGRGGLLSSGRWHTKGRPVVYLTDSPSSAMLETLIHLEMDAEDLPTNFNLLRVRTSDNAVIEHLTELPEDWRDDQDYTQDIGNKWLARGETVLLAVPSAVMPHTENFLFNPLHPDAEDTEVTVELHQFDPRLLRPR